MPLVGFVGCGSGEGGGSGRFSEAAASRRRPSRSTSEPTAAVFEAYAGLRAVRIALYSEVASRAICADVIPSDSIASAVMSRSAAARAV